MFKSLASIALLLFFCWQTEAQEIIFFDFDPKPSEKESLDFAITEVIDARLSNHSCGHIPGKIPGQRIPIDFAEGLQKGMQQLLPQLFEFRTTNHQICVVIREFWITSWGYEQELGQFSALYDFYLKKGDKYQHLWREQDQQEGNNLNIKKSHHQNIEKSLRQACHHLAQIDWNEAIQPAAEWKSRAAVIAESQSFAITQTNALNAGIYLSYMEFRANKPTITDVEIQVKKGKDPDILSKREVQFKGLSDPYKGSFFPKRIWGFCDGQRVYINNWSVFQENSYSPLLSFGKYCPFIGKDNLREASNVSMGTLVSAEVSKTAYVFDAEQGQAYLLDDAMLLSILEGRDDLIHKYKQERDRDNLLTKTWYVSAAMKARR